MIFLSLFHNSKKEMKYIFILFLLIIGLASCRTDQNDFTDSSDEKVLILVSKDFNNVFRNWLIASTKSEKIDCINIYSIKQKDSVEKLLSMADGIIISGGEDINPEIYGKPEEIVRCEELDTYRDSLEQQMIGYALNHQIPILGICRGHQILNATNGGTLIIDIPEDIGSQYTHRDKRKNKENMSTRTYHSVYIKHNTLLHGIIKADSGQVHSNHHQAIEELAPRFTPTSYAKDSIIESIELSDTLTHPFVLGVQWHPEAMDVGSPFSGNIGRAFMEKVKMHRSKK